MRQILSDFGKTVLLVSHDRDEVYRLSDRIAVVSDGRMDAFGTKAEVFANPQTRMGAMLTGCKNLSAMEILDDRHIKAVDWDMVLEVPEIPADAKAVGIRMHSIRPGEGTNSFRCRVMGETENPFSFTVMLSPVGSDCAVPIGWELDKSDWEKLRSEEVDICIPKEALLLLKDKSSEVKR